LKSTSFEERYALGLKVAKGGCSSRPAGTLIEFPKGTLIKARRAALQVLKGRSFVSESTKFAIKQLS